MDKQKIDAVASELFTFFLERELTEQEVVATVVQALTIRLAYAAKDIPELEEKIRIAGECFSSYARINLGNAQSAILAKQANLKELH